uniref:RNase H type-1 domain-containing protein n=1 Tax=Panagrolaimus sp. JU765 TaxID=591449 RepID=A0AC34Q666_9BILA
MTDQRFDRGSKKVGVKRSAVEDAVASKRKCTVDTRNPTAAIDAPTTQNPKIVSAKKELFCYFTDFKDVTEIFTVGSFNRKLGIGGYGIYFGSNSHLSHNGRIPGKTNNNTVCEIAEVKNALDICQKNGLSEKLIIIKADCLEIITQLHAEKLPVAKLKR